MTSVFLFIFVILAGFMAVALYRTLFSDVQQRLKEVRQLMSDSSWAPARVILENVIAEDDELFDGHYLMAKCCSELDAFDRAVMEYRRCITLGGSNDVSLLKLQMAIFQIFQKQNNLKEMLTSLSELRKLDGGNADWPFEMARILIVNFNDFSRNTTELLNDVAEKNPAYPGLSFLKGLHAYKNSDFEKAKQHFSESATNDKADFGSHFYIGDILYKQQQYKAALPHFEEARNNADFRRAALYGSARCYFQSQAWQQAITAFEDSLRMHKSAYDPANLEIEAHYYCGLCYEKLEDFVPAMNHWDKVAKADRDFQDVQEKLKKYSTMRISDSVVELNTLSDNDFKEYCHKLITTMNYNILEIMVMKSGNCQALAKETKGDRILTAIFVNRSKEFQEESDVSTLKRYMFENRARKALLMTTGEITTAAEQKETDGTIRFINHLELARLIEKMQQAV